MLYIFVITLIATMNDCKLIRLLAINCLPEEIIINHIMPYTYCPQPMSLLMDIKSFYQDYNLIDSYYNYDYNNHVLLYDLLTYVYNYYTLPPLFKRHFFYKNKNSKTVLTVVENSYSNYGLINTDRKIRSLWGLFSQRERTGFINRFILADEE